MHLSLASLLIFTATFGGYAEAQYNPSYFYGQNVFRAGFPHPSFENQLPSLNEGRSFYTLKLTLATKTITSTTTTTTTCTTSTSTLSQCSASGRRRRRFALRDDSKSSDGLFYRSEDEEESLFLPSLVS